MLLDWRALWRACIIVFLLFAVVCPLSNYRDWLWLVILGVGVSAPILLLATILLVASLIAVLYRRRRVSLAAVIGASALFLGALLLVLLHPNLSVFRTMWYMGIEDAAFRIVIKIPSVVLVVPIAAAIVALRQVLMKNWSSALVFAAVPAVGALLFYSSGLATDLLTVWSCARPIQSALQTVKAGGHLPKESQQYPIAVLQTNPDIAVEDLESFMDFPSFIAYDTGDRFEAAVAMRVQKSETPACGHASARRIWGDYYWVNIAC